MKHFVLVALVGLGLAGSSCSDRHGDEAQATTSGEVAGTVLDRTTGGPIADVRLTFPDGREVRTNEQGRFLAADLPIGLSGELVARAEDGREGRIALRPLGRRQLEVVVYAGLSGGH